MNSAKIIKRATTSVPPLNGPVTKRQVVEAKVEAQKIIAKAEQDAAAIRENATAFASETREKAYQEGHEAALLEWNTLLLEAHDKRDYALATVEGDVLRLAVKIAGKIIGRELKRDKATIAEIVANALRHARRNEMITVRVNPAELVAVEANREKLDPGGRAHFIDIVGDPRVNAGGCIIESESGAIDAQLETQLRVLERALLTRTAGGGEGL
ncbi:MAG TPA: type III secretion system stator protein SctL [Pyrinomonadaceae bacterium]|nr:type III secretion system stator protein SctL [Pyrinomonadaceae bacterium]